MKDNNQQLTLSKKQSSLTERLQQVCNKINHNVLPLEVNRVEAFGSYIRGKQNPNDIDLIVYYNDNKGLDYLYDLLKTIFKEMKVDYKSTPNEIVSQYVMENFKKTTADFLIGVYSSWLDRFTWNHIEYAHNPPNRQVIFKKMLVGGTKNIHIADVLKTGERTFMRAKESRMVWNPEKPIVLENYKWILTNELENIVSSELENLSLQLEWMRLKNTIIKGLYCALLKFNTRIESPAILESWLVNELASIFPSYPDNLLKAAVSESGFSFHSDISDDELRKTFQTMNLNDYFEDLKRSVEEVREDLDEIRMELIVNYRAFILLRQWKRKESSADPFFSPTLLWIAWRTLIEIPKKDVPEEIIRKYMRQINLPEEKISADRRYGRVEYRFPEEEAVY